jgi:hypothetical protein
MKHMFCLFLSFRDLSEPKRRIFLALLFLPENQHEKKKHTSGPTRPKRVLVARALGLATPGPRHLISFDLCFSDVIHLHPKLTVLT